MRTTLLAAMGLGLAAWVGRVPACAETPAPPERFAIDYRPAPPFDRGLASDAEVAKESGSARYDLTLCTFGEVDVVITMSDYNPASTFSLGEAELVRRAIFFAHERCPWGPQTVHYIATTYAGETENELWDVSLIDSGPNFNYSHINIHYSDHWWGRRFRDVLYLIGLFLLYNVARWLWWHWPMFVRWYFWLTPHPASDMVKAAVRGGVELDGEAFREIMSPMPGGRIEKEVRAQQARELASIARQSNEALLRKADELRQRIREEAAYQAAQEGLQDAAISQQLAARRAEVLAELEEFMKRNAAHDKRSRPAPQG